MPRRVTRCSDQNVNILAKIAKFVVSVHKQIFQTLKCLQLSSYNKNLLAIWGNFFAKWL